MNSHGESQILTGDIILLCCAEVSSWEVTQCVLQPRSAAMDPLVIASCQRTTTPENSGRRIFAIDGSDLRVGKMSFVIRAI